MGKVNKNWLRKTLGKKEFNRRETMKIKISVKKSKGKTKKAVRREALAAHEMTRGLANNNTGYYSGEVAGNKAVKILRIMDKTIELINKRIREIPSLGLDKETENDDIQFYKDRMKRIKKKHSRILNHRKIIKSAKDVHIMLEEVIEVLPLLDDDFENVVNHNMNEGLGENTDADANAHADADLDNLLGIFGKLGM